MNLDQQNNTSIPSSSTTIYPIQHRLRFIIVFTIVLVLSALVCGSVGYHLGTLHNSQQGNNPSFKLSSPKRKLPIKQKNEPSKDESLTTIQPKTYTVSYTIPTGWSQMLWHITDGGVENAILAPDYTSIADPEPQTGMSIIIYQFPGTVSDIHQLRPIVEQTEDGLQSLSETTIDGYSTWYAIFQCWDANRVLYDYHILKDHDHWVIRLIFPGTSLQVARDEAQKYNYQIKEFLQSTQFKTSKYQ